MSDYGPRNAPEYMRRYYDDHADRMKQQIVVARRRRQLLVARPVEPQPVTLSPRERQVLDLLVVGLLNKEIAAKLFLAEGTVKAIAGRLYAKLNVRNRAEAVRAAIMQQIEGA